MFTAVRDHPGEYLRHISARVRRDQARFRHDEPLARRSVGDNGSDALADILARHAAERFAERSLGGALLTFARAVGEFGSTILVSRQSGVAHADGAALHFRKIQRRPGRGGERDRDRAGTVLVRDLQHLVFRPRLAGDRLVIDRHSRLCDSAKGSLSERPMDMRQGRRSDRVSRMSRPTQASLHERRTISVARDDSNASAMRAFDVNDVAEVEIVAARSIRQRKDDDPAHHRRPRNAGLRQGHRCTGQMSRNSRPRYAAPASSFRRTPFSQNDGRRKHRLRPQDLRRTTKAR